LSFVSAGRLCLPPSLTSPPSLARPGRFSRGARRGTRGSFLFHQPRGDRRPVVCADQTVNVHVRTSSVSPCTGDRISCWIRLASFLIRVPSSPTCMMNTKYHVTIFLRIEVPRQESQPWSALKGNVLLFCFKSQEEPYHQIRQPPPKLHATPGEAFILPANAEK